MATRERKTLNSKELPVPSSEFQLSNYLLTFQFYEAPKRIEHFYVYSDRSRRVEKIDLGLKEKRGVRKKEKKGIGN